MRKERQLLFWLAALIIVVMAALWLREVLLPFVVGMIIAYALNPVTERLVAAGLSRTAASGVVVALIIVVLGLLALFLLPPLLAQLQQLAESMPAILTRLRSLIEDVAKERLGARFGEFKSGLDQALTGAEIDWSAIAPGVLRQLWTQGLAVVNFVSLLLITPLVVFYLLVDWHPMLRKIDGWLPRDHAATIRGLADEINAAIGAFIRGQGLVCVILGVFYAVGLSWAGLRYGLLIGLATGILSFVPFAGWALGLMLSAATILVQTWPDLMPLYKVLGVFAVGMALDSALLSPKIVGSRVGLHPLWLIVALFVFSYALGFVGVLVAVPLAAAIAVLVRYAIQVYLGSSVYRGQSPAGSPAATTAASRDVGKSPP